MRKPLVDDGGHIRYEVRLGTGRLRRRPVVGTSDYVGVDSKAGPGVGKVPADKVKTPLA